MKTADVRSLACTYVRNGAVRVVKARHGDPPAFAKTRVTGRQSTYFVRLTDGVWVCSCGEADSCAHVASVRLVTGHDGPASPARER